MRNVWIALWLLLLVVVFLAGGGKVSYSQEAQVCTAPYAETYEAVHLSQDITDVKVIEGDEFTQWFAAAQTVVGRAPFKADKALIVTFRTGTKKIGFFFDGCMTHVSETDQEFLDAVAAKVKETI
jgi:hypothetical protein